MSKYLCGKCHRFYDTQPEMKSCTHEDVKIVKKETPKTSNKNVKKDIPKLEAE